MLKVILLRHGETAYNADGNRYCGLTDIGLTEKGLRQARQVAVLLRDLRPDAVYASPLKRAQLTASIASGGQKVITDARLIELDFGVWEGETKETFIAKNPQLWEQWMADPATAHAGGTGENGQQVVDRVSSFFREMQQRHHHQTIMVVAHNGVNRLYMAAMLGMPLNKYRSLVQENSSITVLEFEDDGTMVLRKLNADSV